METRSKKLKINEKKFQTISEDIVIKAPVLKASKYHKYRNINWLRLIGLIVIFIAIVWYIFSFFVGINSWKAVFLDNNQVFFGKFANVPFSSSITLHKTYYLRPSSASSTNSAEILSIKDNSQSPQDFLVISKFHILYTEQLKPKGIMSQALDKEESRGN